MPRPQKAPVNRGKPVRRQSQQKLDGTDMDEYQLANADRGYHYVWAEQGGGARSWHSRERYESIGFEVALAQESGVNLKWGKTVTKGQPIIRNGLILMQVPMRDDSAPMDYAALDAYGRDGRHGQEYLDERLRAVREGVVDGTDLRSQPAGLTPEINISPYTRED